MHIQFVEIENFRKLESVHIDFTDQTTLFVGANNSGKTSAMVALRHFLVDPKRISMNDFTLSHWAKIKEIGKVWQTAKNPEQAAADASLADWEGLLPTLDVWFQVEDTEIHHVSRLLPNLEWVGGLLGVRLRFEPIDTSKLAADYLANLAEAKATMEAAKAQAQPGDDYGVKLWPQDLLEYLGRKLHDRFRLSVYSLDPNRQKAPVDGVAQPQPLPQSSEPIEGDPLRSLIRVDEVNAQRGLGTESNRAEDSPSGSAGNSRKLSDQARSYYNRHLDPTDRPQPSDLLALRAIEKAEELFNDTLSESFADPVGEVEGLGYPGVTDPKIKISTRVRPVEGLNHDSAVQYEIASASGPDATTTALSLPEDYNGLGYQNLIWMVFRLMSYRAAWMRVGKMSRAIEAGDRESIIPPLHLVLVEEPEAHLHAQVQQVFIRKAYKVLRNHSELGDNKTLRTQLVVSTHSSHVAHEVNFSCLRYFRRRPASESGSVPTSTVINLSTVFGTDKETQRFDTRYLRATHSDLFFADAAILIEGTAERMLVPHFMRGHFDFLTQSYITLLEIGGSHAHRLRPLIEALGLVTLIITDLDASKEGESARPKPSDGQTTTNATLKQWLPKTEKIDGLLALGANDKELPAGPLFSVRVAYQMPVKITLGGAEVEVTGSTFEDALALENLSTFASLNGIGLIAKFRKDITANSEAEALCQAMYDSVRASPKKAEFALEMLELKDPEKLVVPQQQLKRKQFDVLSTDPDAGEAGA